MLFYGKSDIGMKRSVNQDNYMTRMIDKDSLAAVVCDGMGGTSGGSIASSIAMDVYMSELIKRICSLLSDSEGSVDNVEIPRIIRDSVEGANSFLFKISQKDNSLNGMGTTLVSALIFKDEMFVCNVGDSRLYQINSSGISQITHDHSFVQYLVDSGKISASEAKNNKNKNIITRAIGVSPEVECDIFRISLEKDNEDYFLLCTDGLSNLIDDADIKNIILDEELPEISEKVEQLIERANKSGGTDNITALLIKV